MIQDESEILKNQADKNYMKFKQSYNDSSLITHDHDTTSVFDC